MCRPGHGFFAGPVRGRTHRSAPTRGGVVFRIQRGLAQDGTSSKGAEQSPPLAAGCAWGTAGCGHPALRKQHRWCPAKGRCRHRPLRPAGGREGGTPGSSCPTGGCGEPPALASGAERSVCGAVAREWVGIAAEIIPKGAINAGQSLSHGEAVTAPFTQGSLRGRGMRIATSALRASSQ